MLHRAVITGLGIVSPIGTGIEKFWANAKRGYSGVGWSARLEDSDLLPHCKIVGEVTDFHADRWLPPAAAKTTARFTQFAIASALMALEDSGLDPATLSPERTQVAIGTAMSATADLGERHHLSYLRGDDIPHWTALECPAHSATSRLAIAVGARGHTHTVATACAAGLDAIGWAASQIESGRATVVLAGGTDAPLSPYSLSIFHAAGVLSRWTGPPPQASRPFDRLRSGLVLAEGAAVVVVENEEHARSREATIYASVLGFSSLTEGTHLRKVDVSGSSDSKVLSQAIVASRLLPTDIDYISAHGNSMVDYDAAETAGIKHALGAHAWNVPVASIKSMVGQMLGATAALQVVAACLSLRDQTIPPTINYQIPDPACDLDYVPNQARPARLRNVLVHAHGLGGSHSALLLQHPPYSPSR